MPPPLHLIITATGPEAMPLLDLLEGEGPLPLSYGEGRLGSVRGVTVAVAWLGVGKANTAAGLALAIDGLKPTSVLQMGIGGCFPYWGLGCGTAAVASEETHLDLGVLTESGLEDLESLGFPLLASPRTTYNRVPVDAELSSVLAAARWPLVPFGTAESVTGVRPDHGPAGGRFRVAVESMEGAAAAQVCLAMGVPFCEVRGISNEVGERDKGKWQMEPALSAATEVVERWLVAGAPLIAATANASTRAG